MKHTDESRTASNLDSNEVAAQGATKEASIGMDLIARIGLNVLERAVVIRSSLKKTVQKTMRKTVRTTVLTTKATTKATTQVTAKAAKATAKVTTKATVKTKSKIKRMIRRKRKGGGAGAK